MNFLNFEYILAICRAGTIRGAAEQLYISPQSLSEHLGKLEQELGAPLFLRTRPLKLTEAGESFVRCAEACMGARRTLEDELTALRRREEHSLVLGVPTGMTPPLMLQFLARFRVQAPATNVTLVELPTRTGVVTEIPSIVDAVMTETASLPQNLRGDIVASSDRFVVAVHRALLTRMLGKGATAQLERRAEAGELTQFSELQACPFVIKRMGTITRVNEERIFRAVGFRPYGAAETGDMDTTQRMVMLGEAAVFFPEPVARVTFRILAGEEGRNVVLLPVPAGEERWQIAVLRDRWRGEPEGLENLISSARSYYGELLGC